jgi:hypothetical protein
VKTPTEESGRRARGRRFACTGSHVGNFPQRGWNIAYNPGCPAQRSISAATHRNAACVRASIKRTRMLPSRSRDRSGGLRDGLGSSQSDYRGYPPPCSPSVLRLRASKRMAHQRNQPPRQITGRHGYANDCARSLVVCLRFLSRTKRPQFETIR